MANSNNVVPGEVDPTVDPLSIIPQAHLGTVVSAAQNRIKSGGNSASDKQLLNVLQQAIALLTGNGSEKRDDVVMVNPHGRIIEVAGEFVDEWINKPGFRAATPEEVERYRTAMLRQTAEYLQRREAKRIADQKKLMLELENEEESSGLSDEDLVRANVTDAQKTGALSPEQVRQLNRTQETANTPPSKDSETKTSPKDKQPPKRGNSKQPASTDDDNGDGSEGDGPSSSDIEDV